MAHSKNDFKFQSIFANKHYLHTYIAYLYNGRPYPIYEQYYARTYFLPNFIVNTIDYIIKANNAICRRGTLESNLNDLEKIFKPMQLYYSTFNSYVKKTYDEKGNSNWEYWLDIKEELENAKKFQAETENEKKVYSMIYPILEKLVWWTDNFKNDYEGFKDFIYDSINYINDNHFTYIVGQNIIYKRSKKDNEKKKYYCSLIGNKQYNIFKELYYNKTYLPNDNNKTFEQICDLLINIADIYNELIEKSNEALDILKEYVDTNIDMLQCKDIYYAKIYFTLRNLANNFNEIDYNEKLNTIKDFIEWEIIKYKKYLCIYEFIPTTKEALDNGEYVEI